MTTKIFGEQERRLRALLDGEEPTPEAIDRLLTKLEAPAVEVPIEQHPKDRENEILKASLTQLMAKIEDLSKAKDEEASGTAQANGQLPSTSIAAPPLGWRGLGDVPRGKWLMSPFGIGPGGSGQKMRFKLCDCANDPRTLPGRGCTSVREYHFFCMVCLGGPFDIVTTKAIFKRASMAPADLWGIMHYACAGPCAAQFMAQLGQSPAMVPLQQAVPVMPDAMLATQNAPEPSRPMVLLGSD